jgi:branched-chain amino acid transport system permease protein
MFEFFLQIALSGIATGAIYSVIAVGYSITYATMRVLNFALGMWVMLGGMLTYSLHVDFGLPLSITLVIILAVMSVLGIIGERISVFPFVRAGSDAWIMSTLAVGFLFINIAELVWGQSPKAVPPYLGESIIKLGPLSVFPQHLLVIAAALVIFYILHLFYFKTLMGRVFRATAHNAEVASLMGVNTRQVCVWSYIITSALAGFAGAIVVPITLAEPQLGTVLGLKAFAIAIIAGLDSPRGILVCGLAYGAVEALLAGYFYTGIRDILGFSLMILALYLKPEGLFGRAVQERA